MPLITLADFEEGQTKLGQDKYTTDKIQEYIDDFEPVYTRRIIGDRLTAAFDITKAKFAAIANGVTYINSEGETVTIEGLKKALRYLIWVEYVRDSNTYNNSAGTSESQTENSTVLSPGALRRLLRNRYNTGAKAAQDVHAFISEFRDNQCFASSIALDSGTTYLVLVSDTRYLTNGDTVTINDVDYVISNLVSNTSFEIESPTDISGVDVLVYWDVFGTFEQDILEDSDF